MDAYDESRAVLFTGAERAAASAAARWVMTYNARCELAMLAHGGTPADGSYLWRLSRERDATTERFSRPRRRGTR